MAISDSYSVVYPPSVTQIFPENDAVLSVVGTAPQWQTEDSDTSYVSFVPGNDYSIASFDIGVDAVPGIPYEWWQSPRIIMQSQSMGFAAGDPFWYIYFVTHDDYGTGPTFNQPTWYTLQSSFEPYRGWYFSGEVTSEYSVNVWNMRTEFPGPDPEDPDYVPSNNATFVQYGFGYELYYNTWADDMYERYLAGEVEIEFWAGGGSGDLNDPYNELRLSLFGLVLPLPLPDLDGELTEKRRKFWRPRPGW